MITLPKLMYDEPMVTKTFSTPQQLYNAARDKAQEEHRSLSAIIRLCLELYLEDKFPPAKKT
jgi:hypothetical protein